MAGAIVYLGIQRCLGMKQLLRDLESYQQALEALESNVRAKHDPLPISLRACAEGAEEQTKRYLYALADSIRTGETPTALPPGEASPLPLETLRSGLDLEGVLRLIALCRARVADQVRERREALPGRCRATLSAGACLAALSVIVLI